MGFGKCLLVIGTISSFIRDEQTGSMCSRALNAIHSALFHYKKVFERLDCLVSSMTGHLCYRLFHTVFLLLFLYF